MSVWGGGFTHGNSYKLVLPPTQRRRAQVHRALYHHRFS
jgi:hypothetical protein